MTESPAPRWRGLTSLLTANALAWTGTRLTGLAVPWFVLTTTGSAVQTGLVVFAQMAPYVLAQALSGPVIDRLGAKRISVVCDLVVAAALAAVPVFHALDMLTLPVLMGLLAIVGIADGPANAAKGQFVPEVTRRAGVPLERTTGLTGTVERLASTVGPAIGGFLIGAWGGVGVLAVTAALAALAALVVAVGLPEARVQSTGASGEHGDRSAATSDGYFARLKQGLAFLRSDPLLLVMYGMVATTNLLDAAAFSILLPVWTLNAGLGPEFMGLLASVLSGASIVSSLMAAAWGHRLPRRAVFLAGFMLGGAPRFLILAFDAPVAAILGTYALAGAGLGFVNPIIGAIMFERIPPRLLGTVRGLGTAFAWVGMPFGGLVGGWAVALAGAAPALLTGGAVYFLATLLPGLLPQWAAMDRHGTNRRAEERG